MEAVKKREKYDAVVVGSGLAGLSCAYELSAKGKKVLVIEKHPYAGGRTSSFNDNGMDVESGLHRYIGYYSSLPALLKKCGVKLTDIVTWEEKADILVKGENKKLVLGVAPLWGFGKTVRSIFGNNGVLSWHDKLSVLPFFACGFTGCLFSEKLDEISIAEYADKHHVTERAKRLIIEPMSSGIFFLPPENYSAYAFFGLFAPAIPKFYKMRIGAFLGGMTEVMCNPIVEKIKSLGGAFIFNEPVSEAIVENSDAAQEKGIKVIGVKTESGREYYAEHTVIAASLPAAKEILNPLKQRRELEKLFALPVMSAATLQMELDRPALEKDITTFGPGSDMVSFAEQSRTTFRSINSNKKSALNDKENIAEEKGRLSLILGNPDEYIDEEPQTVLETVISQMGELGVELSGHVTDYRKVTEKNEFYSLDIGSQKLRPKQKTGIDGLVLAGDYTLTSSFATMEGAVISGKKAARCCIKQDRKAEKA